jgi:hypothetical protein
MSEPNEIPELTEESIRKALDDLPRFMAEREKDAEDERSLRGKYAPATGTCVVCGASVVPDIVFPWDGRLGGPPVSAYVKRWHCEGCGIVYQVPPNRKPATEQENRAMSWSYEKTGKPEAVIKDATAYFDKTAESYKGQPEADDVRACKERIIALVNACDLSTDSANAVVVKANGSHYAMAGGKIGNATFQVSVGRVSLALD